MVEQNTDAAAIQIQTWWRMAIAKQRYAATVAKVVVAQNKSKAFVHRKRYLAQLGSAVLIQRWWRRVLAKRFLASVRVLRDRENFYRQAIRNKDQTQTELDAVDRFLKDEEDRLDEIDRKKNMLSGEDLEEQHVSDGQNLARGDEFEIPPSVTKVMFGLGWTIEQGQVWDLDASVLTYRYTDHIEDVYYLKKKSADGAIYHAGDSRTGGGGIDDEQIYIELPKISKKINTLMFVVTVFTPEGDFSKVINPFVRLVDVTHSKNPKSENEMCRFTLENCGTTTAQIMCKVYRYSPSTWRFLCLGEPSYGQIYKHLIPRVVPFLQQAPVLRILTITVHQASDITDSSNGLSSFFILRYDTEKVTSKVCPKSATPTWNQTFSISGQANHAEIDVFSQQGFSKNKFLGRVVFDVSSDFNNQWFSFLGRGKEKDRKLALDGKLLVSVVRDTRADAK